MSEAIITAIITGGVSLIGVVITCLMTARKTENTMRINQAVTDTKIDELTREVRRMPVVEEQIKVINHRIDDLENYHKPD